MTDVNSPPPASTLTMRAERNRASPAAGAVSVPEEAVELMELLFFAYRDFTGDADKILAEFGFGRAHHRVLHFVSRYPELRVADLLVLLKITKQSLARVLKELIARGLISQAAGSRDRRERRLSVTAEGQRLMSRLMLAQAQRIGRAARVAGPGSAEAARRLLMAMIDPRARETFAALTHARHLSLSPPVAANDGQGGSP